MDLLMLTLLELKLNLMVAKLLHTKRRKLLLLVNLKPVLEVQDPVSLAPVSYTHLDVYKRQEFNMAILTKAENGVENNNQIMNFVNDEFGSIRCIEIEGTPYFVGNDIAIALGYSNYRNAVSKHVDVEDKLRTQIEYAGQMRNVTVINESGVYDLIFNSKLDSAKRFRRWVTSEVLPQIRRTGGYIPYKNLSEAEFVLKALEIQQATIAELRGELEASKEDIDFARCVTASSDTLDVYKRQT